MDRWWAAARRGPDAPPDDRPVILAVEGPHGPVIHGVSRGAALRGARAGQRVVDARAAAPDLEVAWADPADDATWLRRLARWAGRWSPFVAVDGRDGLALDTTGADHLFGGEAEMLRDVEARLSGAGLSARLAVAPSRGAAWALARFGPVRAVCTDLADLDPLPVAALRLPPDPVRALTRLGLKTVGELRAVARPALMRRFARAAPEANPLVRLDQAWGRLPEPLAAPDAPRAPRALLRLAEPVLDPTPLLPDLARTLAARLDRHGEGCRGLRLTVFRTDGETRDVAARLARPTRDPDHMVRLLEGRLEGIDPGFGFDAALLEGLGPERLDAAQPDLTGAVDEAEALARLIDRLAARLGPAAVVRPVLRDSHVPERAQGLVPAAYGMPDGAGGAATVLERPLRPAVLLDPPEPLRVLYAVPEGPPVRLEWRRRRLDVTRYAGPERIAPEWWRDRPGTRLRDYYRVEDAEGCRYWLYREGVIGDRRGGAPRWFMHGLFP